MRRGNFIDWLRRHVADLLGIQDKAASRGEWWEIDVVIAIIMGSIIIGIWALSQI